MKLYLKTSWKQVCTFVFLSVVVAIFSLFFASVLPPITNIILFTVSFVILMELEERLKIFRGYNGKIEYFIRKLYYLPAIFTFLTGILLINLSKADISAMIVGLMIAPFIKLFWLIKNLDE